MSTKKRSLGRGLGALLAAAPESSQSQPTSFDVALDRLHPNRFQPRTRFDDAGLDELASSIREQGIVQPLVVSRQATGDFTIIAGERRWRAARLAGLSVVPVIVREVSGDLDFLKLALVENLQRRDLDPIEEADAYRMLVDAFHLSQEDVARQVGKARTTVTNALRLLRLPPEVQDWLRSGELTPGQARPLLSHTDADQQIQLARRAVQEGLTARDLESFSRTANPKPSREKKPDSVDVNTAAAADRLTRELQTSVEIRRKGKGGEVRIRFHSEEELIRLYDLFISRGETE